MNDNAKVAFLSPLSSSQKEKNYSPSKQPDETASKSLELPLPHKVSCQFYELRIVIYNVIGLGLAHSIYYWYIFICKKFVEHD